jgi:hypothetical protein
MHSPTTAVTKQPALRKTQEGSEPSLKFRSFIIVFLFVSCGFVACLSYTINASNANDPYRVRTAPLTSKRCILYIYSTNIGTEYFKHGIYSSFSPLQNAVCFIILTYLVPVLFAFYIQGVLKLKKNNSGAKRLTGLKYFKDHA